MPNAPRVNAKGPDKALTAKQRRFVEEYVIDMNAFRAARRAGYSPKSSSCVNMMRQANIAAAVEQALVDKRARAAARADQVIEELCKIAFASMTDYVRGEAEVDLAGLSREAGAAISRLRVEYAGAETGPRTVRRVSVTLADKTAALKALARCLGLDRDRPEPDERIELITGVPRHPDFGHWRRRADGDAPPD